MMPSIKLTYFDIEGVAEKIRLAFILSEVDFEDNRIAFSEWAELKPKTPHGTLPILTIDDGPAKVQSDAILRWVATLKPEAGLYPSDKAFEIDEAIGLLDDMKNSFYPLQLMKMRPERFGHTKEFVSSKEGEEKIAELRKKWIAESLPRYLSFIADMIEKSGGKWLVQGNNPTIADAYAIPILRVLTTGVVDHVDPNCLDINPVVVEYVKNFCALPQVKGRYSKGLGSN